MYAVDVTVSDHESLKQGVTERPVFGRRWHRILISADEVGSDWQAVLLAAQIAGCTGGPTLYRRDAWPKLVDGMCTSADLVSWPT